MIPPLPKALAANIIGLIVMIMAAGILVALFTLELPQGNREVALVILGTAIGWTSNVVAFHFGSSAGSRRKDDMIAKEKP